MTGSSKGTGLEAPAQGRSEAAEKRHLFQASSTHPRNPGAVCSKEREFPCGSETFSAGCGEENQEAAGGGQKNGEVEPQNVQSVEEARHWEEKQQGRSQSGSR